MESGAGWVSPSTRVLSEPQAHYCSPFLAPPHRTLATGGQDSRQAARTAQALTRRLGGVMQAKPAGEFDQMAGIITFSPIPPAVPLSVPSLRNLSFDMPELKNGNGAKTNSNPCSVCGVVSRRSPKGMHINENSVRCFNEVSLGPSVSMTSSFCD